MAGPTHSKVHGMLGNNHLSSIALAGTPGTDPASCQFAGGFGQIEVWRSTDAGNTFQGPVSVGPDETDTAADPFCNTGRLNQGSMPVIGNDGSVYVTWTRGPRFLTKWSPTIPPKTLSQ
ncbi:MAG TPA: hypothetical protein VFE98_00235 [Candidatus Bathyarchaeia archaeon]|nr:hypothetical protein [Candidatus Bathyarchaeia archaeon]